MFLLSGNLKSVQGLQQVVRDKLAKEVREGWMLDPLMAPPLQRLRISLLGVMPKKTPEEFQLIHHLLYPKGASVNNAIPEHLCSVRYTTFDAAVAMVQECGPGAELAKCDTWLK